MKFILGQKLGMSQIFTENKLTPVTLIEAGPCKVVQVKTEKPRKAPSQKRGKRKGYNAVQIGFGQKKRLTKAIKGHFKKLKDKFAFLREFRVEKPEFKVGDEINVSSFKVGDIVKVSGISKGKGFQGVVKRWGFKGSPAGHGTKHALRAPGSIGSAFPQRVFKGMKMGGRMGAARITVSGLEVVKVDAENNLLAVKGAVPGRKGTLLEIRSE